MCALVTVDDRHLNIHEDDVRLGTFLIAVVFDIIERFLSIPHSACLEAQLQDFLQGNLLVNGTNYVSRDPITQIENNLLVLDDQDKDV